MVRLFGMSHVMAGLPGRVASDSDEFRISEPVAQPVPASQLDPWPVGQLSPLEAVSAQMSRQTGLEVNETTALLLGLERALNLCDCGCQQPTEKLGRRFLHGHNLRLQSRRRPPTERFWETVDSSSPDACWPWSGCRTAGGYGLLGVNGRLVLAHRVAWELAHPGEPIPPETPFIRHVVCRNPPCCNPAHLAPGTQADNMRDMVADGTSASGERHGQARLNAAAVLAFRRLAAGGLSQRVIARRFGVNPTTIRDILIGHTWAHVQEAV